MNKFVKKSKYEYWRWRVFAITWVAYAAYYLTRKAFPVAKVGIEKDSSMSISAEMMANMDATYLACYAIGQFFWGMLADKFGSRVVVLGGLIMTACAVSFMGLFPAVLIFFLTNAINGFAQSTGWPSLCKNVSSFFSSGERGRVMGFWCTNYTVGGLIASPLAGWVAYTIMEDWRYALYTPAAVVLFVAVLFAIFQRNSPQDVGLPPVEEYHNEPMPLMVEDKDISRNAWGTIKVVFKNRTILALGLVYFLLKPARYAILFWGPYIVYKKMPEADLFVAATVPIAFEVAGILGPILIGFASDKLFGSRRMPACAISLFLLTIALLLFIPLSNMGLWVIIFGFFLIGLTLYGPDSMVSSSAAMDFGTRKGAGSATGFVNGCGSIGAILGGLVPGYFEVDQIFYGFAGINFLAALVLLSMWNKLPAITKPS